MKLSTDMIKPAIYINTNRDSFENLDCPKDIGKVVDDNTSSLIALIIFDRNCFQNLGYHLCVQKIGQEYYIVMDEYYSSMLGKHDDELEGLLLHEVGHIVNGDFSTYQGDSDAVHNYRKKSVLHGTVAQNELGADLFAANIVGRDQYLKALDLLIKKRRERVSDQGRAFAIQELVTRKRLIQQNMEKD